LSNVRIMWKRVKFLQDRQHSNNLKLQTLRVDSAIQGNEALLGFSTEAA
jgi:hypothetical protein